MKYQQIFNRKWIIRLTVVLIIILLSAGIVWQRANRRAHAVPRPLEGRGVIHDIRGIALTGIQERSSASLSLDEARKFRDFHQEEWLSFSSTLALTLGIDENLITNKMNGAAKFCWLKRVLTEDESSRLQQMLALPRWRKAALTVKFTKEFVSYYPYGQLMGQLLGFTGIDGKGLAGLQYRYDKELSGLGERLIDGRRGRDIYLTVDAKVQKACEDILEKFRKQTNAKDLAAVVLQTKDAKVLAMVSLPAFDPNHFSEIPYDFLRLRPVIDNFQLGPIIQPFLLASGLEDQGDGFLRQKAATNSSVTIRDAFLRRSDASGTSTISLLGKESAYRALSRFHLDQRTGIDFSGEVIPLVARSDQSDHALSDIGLGYGIAVSPLRLARSFCPMINGGILREPNLVEKFRLPEGQIEKSKEPQAIRVIKPETSDAVRQMLAQWLQGQINREALPDMGGIWALYRPKVSYVSPYRYFTCAFFAPLDNPAFVLVVSMRLPNEAPAIDNRLALHLGKEVINAIHQGQTPATKN